MANLAAMSLEDHCETTTTPSPSSRRSRPRIDDNVYVEITQMGHKRRRRARMDDYDTGRATQYTASKVLLLVWAQGLASTGNTIEEDELRVVCELAGLNKRAACTFIESRVGARLERVPHTTPTSSPKTYRVVRDPESPLAAGSAVELPDNGTAELACRLPFWLAKYRRELDSIEKRKASVPDNTTAVANSDYDVAMAENDEIDIDTVDAIVSSGTIHSSSQDDNIITPESSQTESMVINQTIDESIVEDAVDRINDKKKQKKAIVDRKVNDGLEFSDMVCRDDYSTELAAVVGKDFEPIAVQRTEKLPTHCVIRRRVGTQKQGKHEYDMEGYPQPVDPDLWLAQVMAVYTGPGVSIANRIQMATCLVEQAMGLFMCVGCLRRQAEDTCRFRHIRVLTELSVKLSGKPVATRFLLTPMLVSHDEHQPRPIRIAALRVSASDLRNCSAAQWGEFYMIHAAAEGLMDVLVKELDVVAGAEIPLLQGSVEYGPHPQLGCSAAPIVLRDAVAGSRQLCDICAASILCTYYTCSMCATEICILCFAQWNESPGRQGERIAASSKELSNPIEKCKRFGRGKAVAQIRARHCRSQFVRVSTVSVADIKAVANKASAVLTLGNELGPQDTFDCDGIFSESLSALFEARIADIQKRAGALDEWELPTVYVMPDELSTRDFSQLWRRGVVVVVRGLLSAMDPELWRPEWWIRNAGHLLVNVWDCARGTAMDEAWKLGEFFRLFDGDDVYAHLFDGPPDEPSKGDDDVGMEAEVAMAAEGPMPQEGVVPQEDTKPDQSDLDTEAEGAKLKEKKEAYKLWLKHAKQVKRRILKLKDWPTADDFATVLPEHFERMMAALPFPDYTSRSGRLNMAARLPADHVPADLGPKMYCAYASSEDANGVGTTNLHCDAADAVNIMAYAAPLAEGAPAAAVWDIYPPEAASAIREFIGKSPKGSDPIHDQMRYLTRADRQRLFREKGIRCYRIYQNPGDAVFVPAGCAHQVCNYANAVKVAMDFVSPERIHFCRRLGADFRKLPSIHPRSSDLLQLSSLLWWALVKGSCAAPK